MDAIILVGVVLVIAMLMGIPMYFFLRWLIP